jgi:hypothetical protein
MRLHAANRMQIRRALPSSSERLGAPRPKAAGRSAAAKGRGGTALGILLLAFCAGCVPSSLPALLPPPPASDTAKTGDAAPSTPYETAVIVSGTPTDVYALVARGILGCWFGAGGPLKESHVFQAEADPPAKGGSAEIVIHERDRSLPDQRGLRAYRVSIASEAAGVRVGMLTLRFEVALAQSMAKDVEGWAKGSAGCQLRALLPPAASRADKRHGPSKKSLSASRKR